MNEITYPQHIAIIPDGNRTRAKQHGKTTMEGHLTGAKNSLVLFDYVFSQTPIDVITARFLSTENLIGRSKPELEFLFSLFNSIEEDLDKLLTRHKSNFRWVGSREGLPKNFLAFLDDKQTKHVYPDSPKTIVFCANYGGRDEIIRGIRKIPADQIGTITEDTFTPYLDFGDIKPIDLVIRTKGGVAQRTSGFMAWRIGYAELYFTPEYFPALTPEVLEKAFLRYNSIADGRNFGK